ncbi:tRNA (adenosine(37)-N6)-threonylcarbamoyltransferase complex dimerization subunit type 1 TsaB [Patescibacteria group bacterium]|nr:tRNA (adenosine(37)-N6)-threonylcarbamoyltransferase complex dimerization subunit type 1 TsaB [Patescibacteria group bacterium]
MILHIDTSGRKIIKVKLIDKGKAIKEMSKENEFGSQVLLPLIEKLMKSQKINFKDLKGIEVEKGPGSFTGLRVGVSVANALGFAFGIPVNGKKLETELQY